MEKIYRKTGFFATLFITFLITFITLFTHYNKTLFVQETGNFKIFGVVTIVLAFGLLLKWRYVRQILTVIVGVVAAVMVYVTFVVPSVFRTAYIILTGALLIVLHQLIFSKAVKQYVKYK